MTEIIVTGSAERKLPADRAVLSAVASITDPRRDAVMRAAASEHERLVARAAELVAAGAAERYLANPIDTYSNTWRDERGTQVSEHHASVSVEIVLIDLSLVGELTLELAESGADARVSWELSPQQRDSVLTELRAEAVADATRAAQDFAAAIGASNVEIVSVRDGGGELGGPIPLMRAAGMADKMAPEVTVREVPVSVQVTAAFAASSGARGATRPGVNPSRSPGPA